MPIATLVPDWRVTLMRAVPVASWPRQLDGRHFGSGAWVRMWPELASSTPPPR